MMSKTNDLAGIEMPIFNGATLEDRHEFYKKYLLYCSRMKERAILYKDTTLKPMSIRSCMENEDVLYFIWSLDLNLNSENDLTDAALLTYFKDAKSTTAGSVDELSAYVKKHLRLDNSIKDATSRATKMKKDFFLILVKFNLRNFWSEYPKESVKMILDVVSPYRLKKVMENKMALEKKKLYKNFQGFFTFMAEQLEHIIPFEDISYRTPVPPDNQKPPSAVPRQSPPSTAVPLSNTKPPPTKHSGILPPSNLHSKKNVICIYPKCKGDHHLKDCKKCPETEKKKLLEEFRKSMAAKPIRTNPRIGSFTGASQISPDNINEDEFISVHIGENFMVPSRLDSGADKPAVSRGVLQVLESQGHWLMLNKLPSPIETELADGTIVLVEWLVRLDITISTLAGPLQIKQVECWVIESEDIRFILGLPVMQLLGYNSRNLLNTARQRQSILHYADSPCVENGSKSSLQSLMLPKVEIEEAGYSITEDPDVLDPLLESAKVDESANVTDSLSKMLKEAKSNGCSEDGVRRLTSLVMDYQSLFVFKLGNLPPIDCPPMNVELKPNGKLLKSQARRMPLAHEQFLESHMKYLVECNQFYPNNASTCASPPFIVSKPGPDKYRMTADLRRINNEIVQYVNSMPNRDAQEAKLLGNSCYFNLDLVQSYNQFPLAPSSRDFYSIITHLGTFTSDRVPTGGNNSVGFVQSSMEKMFCDIVNHGVVIWIDDICGYATSEAELLDNFEKVLVICLKYGIRLHPGKCNLFSKSIKWCGKIFSIDGICHDPERIQALVDLPPPTNGGDLQQFICAMNWMRASLPGYNVLVAPLLQLLEEIYRLAASRKKIRCKTVLLSSVGWNRDHVTCYEKCKTVLQEAITLSHPPEDAVVCLFTDASIDFHGGIATWIPSSSIDLPFAEQPHKPLAFLSGAFTGSQSRWNIVEKEAYAIVHAVSKLDYLLIRPTGFLIFTDHQNLRYIFNPYGENPSIQRHTANKLQRWALILMNFNYKIAHIPGLENVWGDLLSRWGSSTTKICTLFQVPRSPILDAEFKWPSLGEIKKNQEDQLKILPSSFLADNSYSLSENGTYVSSSGQIWIPDNSTGLQLRLCIIAHMGAAGHRSIQPTMSRLCERFIWKTIKADIQEFVSKCLHCLSNTGSVIPRPWGEVLHSDVPNEMHHFDYLDMGCVDEDTGCRYCFMEKDDASTFAKATPTVKANAAPAVTCLIDWFCTYGVCKIWVSDRGSHFKNILVDEMRRVFGSHHHFTLALCPWSNGTVEILNSIFVKLVRILLSEFKLRRTQWSIVVPIAISAINFYPSARLGGIAPVTGFTALPATHPLDAFIHPVTKAVVSVAEVIEKQKDHIKETQLALENMHKEMADAAAKKRRQNKVNRESTKGVRMAMFTIGDYVLIARINSFFGNKLNVKWIGPQQVVAVHNDWTFLVQDLLTKSEKFVHASRMKFFHDDQLDVDEEIINHIAYGEGGHCVERLVKVKLDRRKWYIQVKWLGLDDEENSWELAENIKEDVPDVFSKFVTSSKNPDVQRMNQALA